MSFTMHGTGVSGGIAIGHAHLVSRANLEVAHYVLPRSLVAEESARLQAAIRATRTELETLRAHKPANAPSEFDAFLNLHLMILDDELLSEAALRMIESEQCNAEWAVKTRMDTLLAQFDEIEDSYLRDRRNDVIQVVERVLKALTGHPGHTPPPTASPRENLILVAHDLSPADIIQFKEHQFAAFTTDLGGATSHTAIVARSLNIPSVVALHHAQQLMRENDLLVVDGSLGVVIVNPDAQVLAEYKLKRHQLEIERQKLKRLRTARAITLDGVEVRLQANIELPEDVNQVRESGASGIGLFRTEFLFLNRAALPDEEEQFEAYRRVAEAMGDMPVTVRTLDLGADKQLDGAHSVAANPALGLRAIRLCLAEPQMFHTQLRAILRASFFGNIRILLPMLSSLPELQQALHLIEQAKASLAAQHVKFDQDIQVGGMIEIPAAALAIGAFLPRLRFVSIGTNDLIQYTLAIDRTDDSVAHLYDPLHPAVVRLVAGVIRNANQTGVPVAVCGEMAGDVAHTRLLLGLGLREFSMHPAHLLGVKQRVLKTSIREIAPVTLKMIKADEPEKMRSLLARLNA